MDVDVRSLPFPINVVRVEPAGGHRISLDFEVGPDGESASGVFDVGPYLEWPAFAPLRDPARFRKVRVENGTATWPGEVDIAPERLYTGCVGA